MKNTIKQFHFFVSDEEFEGYKKYTRKNGFKSISEFIRTCALYIMSKENSTEILNPYRHHVFNIITKEPFAFVVWSKSAGALKNTEFLVREALYKEYGEFLSHYDFLRYLDDFDHKRGVTADHIHQLARICDSSYDDYAADDQEEQRE